MTRGLGQWQAYAESGETKEERRARIDEAPEELREAIMSHLRTVWASKKNSNAGRRRRVGIGAGG